MAIGQKVGSAGQVKLTIQGTSNVHDWESEATQVIVKGNFQMENGNLIKAEGISVKVPVLSIKSEKGKTMDNKTYDALLAETHPDILFTGSQITVNGTDIVATGTLTIAGQTKPATLKAKWNKVSGGVQVHGSYPLKMTDFGISPPTALMGTMKTRDDVTIEYTFLLK